MYTPSWILQRQKPNLSVIRDVFCLFHLIEHQLFFNCTAFRQLPFYICSLCFKNLFNFSCFLNFVFRPHCVFRLAFVFQTRDLILFVFQFVFIILFSDLISFAFCSVVLQTTFFHFFILFSFPSVRVDLPKSACVCTECQCTAF